MAAFTIMTWNVENLYRAGTKYGPPTQRQYTAKLNQLASVILHLDPDVLALQEIGSPAALGDLVAKLQGRFPHQCLSSRPDGRGIRVGFMSKLAIEDREDITAFPAHFASVPGIDQNGVATSVTTLGRGAVRILIRPRVDLVLHCMTAHLKSKLLTYPSPPDRPRFDTDDEDERASVAGYALLKRTAEAVALRSRANELLDGNAHHALIVLGDLNDVPSAATTQIIGGPGGSEIGTSGFDRRDKGDDARLFNLAPCIAAERRYSRIYRGERELIDHILVSQELVPGEPRRVPTVDSHIDIQEHLPSIEDNPSQRIGEPGSDHAPVTARFEL